MAEAVRHIHSLGIRHRDITPENTLIHGENILLADFGTSFHSCQDTRYTSTSTPGTAKYLPPEATGNRRFGRSGDIFSLGYVFLETVEALSDPILAIKFPHIKGTYSMFVGDPNFRDQLARIKEHKALQKATS